MTDVVDGIPKQETIKAQEILKDQVQQIWDKV